MLRQLDDLLDCPYCPHFINIPDSRIFRIDRLLGSEKNLLLFYHCLLNRGNGPLPAHIKMYDHLRHDGHSPEGNHRQAFYLIVHLFPSQNSNVSVNKIV